MATLELKKEGIICTLTAEDQLKVELQALKVPLKVGQKGFYESCTLAFQRAVAVDTAKNSGAEAVLLAKAWAFVCKWAGKTDPLPSVNSKKTPTKVVASSSVATSTTTAPTYHPDLERDAAAWVTAVTLLCTKAGVSTVDINWVWVKDNVLVLTTYRNSDGYISAVLGRVASIPLDRITAVAGRLKSNEGLTGVIKKLSKVVDTLKAVNESANFYGAFNEVVGLLLSMVTSSPGDRFSMPTHDKNFEYVDLPLGGRIDGKALKVQDIDRIEVRGGIKFYIEVKSDVRTAVQKHQSGVEPADASKYAYQRDTLNPLPSDDEKFGTSQQLLRILAVTQHRQGKVGSTATKNRIDGMEVAVSILNEKDWLELFTSGTARTYSRLGFHLFIGDFAFTPTKLGVICDEVEQRVADWARLTHSVEWTTLLFKEKKNHRHNYFKLHVNSFEPPKVFI
ncbi:hypothetical protein LXT21_32430 [Myxococcus sp. K38C18041901]|uniref:hypothetical protein n=1 Tax=Myxococcus guangdongensis TaxID=2906760 RepID=UPI0020A7603D|nr:hypothetical protein [Myxococcus guangdongensis]MCP3063496.1 hypothetical protein [Myxococcus guangdongensis]